MCLRDGDEINPSRKNCRMYYEDIILEKIEAVNVENVCWVLVGCGYPKNQYVRLI